MRAVTLGVFQRLTQVLFFRFSLFWAVTQRTSVVIYRRRGRAYRSHFQRSSSQRTGGTETSVRNYHYLSRNNREEQRAHPHRGWSLISVLVPFVPQCSVPISHSIPEGQHLVKADSNPVSSAFSKGHVPCEGRVLKFFLFPYDISTTDWLFAKPKQQKSPPQTTSTDQAFMQVIFIQYLSWHTRSTRRFKDSNYLYLFTKTVFIWGKD
jgi:hypothetical protein